MSADDHVVTMSDVEVHFEKSGGLFDVFGETETVQAVDGVSLDIPEDDVVAIVGESGSGKTTLGKAAIGLQRPTAGTVSYRGQDVWASRGWWGNGDISHSEIRRSLQIIHQDPGASLNPNRTVRSTLAEPLKKWQPALDREDRAARILGMLETVGMTPPHDYADRYPHQLSGGEKQRVALVRALLMNPDLILADEAVSALDVSLRVEMMDLMLDLQEQFSTSFLFISHDLSNARYFAEHADGRIGVMYLGELVEIGPAEEVLRNPKHPYTKVLKWATPDLDPDLATATEPPVRDIDIPDPVNPPEGCRFHTRCPAVIQPEDYDLDQDAWLSVFDFRQAVAAGDVDPARVRSRAAGTGTDHEDPRRVPDEAVAAAIREEHDLGPLGDPEAESVLADAIEALVAGDEDGASETLSTAFASVCDGERPPAYGDGDHVARCFLESADHDAETADVRLSGQ